MVKEERFILPVRCKECGTVFDLWHDLQAQEQMRNLNSEGQAFVSFEKRFGRLLKQQSLCWRCREKVFLGMPEIEDADGQAEFEMEFEFE